MIRKYVLTAAIAAGAAFAVAPASVDAWPIHSICFDGVLHTFGNDEEKAFNAFLDSHPGAVVSTTCAATTTTKPAPTTTMPAPTSTTAPSTTATPTSSTPPPRAAVPPVDEPNPCGGSCIPQDQPQPAPVTEPKPTTAPLDDSVCVNGLHAVSFLPCATTPATRAPASVTPATLPATGNGPLVTLAIAAGMLIAGAACLYLTRRGRA